MPPPVTKEQVRQKTLWFSILTSVIGLIGIGVVVMLMWSWRRYNLRLRRNARRDQDMPDIWRAAGQRLAAKMSPYPRPSDDAADSFGEPDEFGEPDDTDEYDDDDGEEPAGR